ncbi:imidazoleglycerol-phosphate dehydratase HisB, partial [Buchnera aphidicola (Hormaphis cornu)]
IPWLVSGVLDKDHSYVIGDRLSDMELAKNMEIQGIQYKPKKMDWMCIRNRLTQINRSVMVFRKTKETKISLRLILDASKESYITTKIKFLDHMLEQISVHSGIYFKLVAAGDLDIDDHHTVEDIGIVLGEALLKLIGNKCGISRFGFTLPMDESLSSCILDISGRPYIDFNAKFKYQKVGDLSTEMIEHFFRSLAYSMKITVHLIAKGTNDHHIAESIFKVFGRSLRQAIAIENNVLPSSKGIL